MDTRTRLAKINTHEDVENQLRRAKSYITLMKGKVIHEAMLEGKLNNGKKVKAAEQTLRELRRLSFDIDDALDAGLPATSVLDNTY